MTAEPMRASASAPQLRLFTPDNAAGDGGSSISAEMTLGQLFETEFVALWVEGKNLSKKTETAYRESVAWWQKLTGDPPLSQIDDFTAAAFVRELCQQPGRRTKTMSSLTVRRHCTNIQKLLSFAGPKGRERHSRRNRGLLDDPPFVEAPETDKPAPNGDFTVSQIHGLYRAAACMTRPRITGVVPAWWWRAALVVCYYTGLRRGQLLSMEYSRLVPWGNGGRITVMPESGKRRRGYHCYLPLIALLHVQRIRTSRERIFEWPIHARQLSHHFEKWLRAAGLPDRQGEGDKFHGIRKTHTTILASLDPQETVRIAQASAGHTDLSTTLDHYINANVTELVQARAVDSMPSPVPPDFVDSGERQRMLF